MKHKRLPIEPLRMSRTRPRTALLVRCKSTLPAARSISACACHSLHFSTACFEEVAVLELLHGPSSSEKHHGDAARHRKSIATPLQNCTCDAVRRIRRARETHSRSLQRKHTQLKSNPVCTPSMHAASFDTACGKGFTVVG